ncbi:histidine phosphatase [Lachnoanaerobaculum umeaense]|uniref:Histidine phosphatase n=1 Tax=Lachnoanaerobaculum umeaense TaxID=617123 RepID=A0A385PZ28_9FIRM|nr:histidine phosphatase [Lachnoanaerobaculum umeaense]
MKVIIIRHGKVDYDWKRKYSSGEFDKACIQYDKSPIMQMSYYIPLFNVKQIYVSKLSRSRDTAMEIFGSREFICTELLNEVPLGSSFNCRIELPLWFWNVTGRIQWLFNISRQGESQKETIARARKFVELLNTEEYDSAVVTHGFYMHILVKEMQKVGFRISKSVRNYKNGDYVVAEK